MKQGIWALALGLSLWACDSTEGKAPQGPNQPEDAPNEKPQPSEVATSTPPGDLPKLDPIPDFRREVTERRLGDLRLETRLLVPTVAPGDPVRVTMSLRPERPEAEVGKEALDWPKTVNHLTVKVKGPDGAVETRRANGTMTWLGSSKLVQSGPMTIHLTVTGIDGPMMKPAAPWVEAGPWLEKPGRYEVTLAGEVALGSGPRPFESAPIVVEVKDGMKTTAEIEQVAGKLVEERFRLKARPTPSKPTLEDAAENLVVRFILNDMGDRYDQRFVETILDRQAKLLSMRSIVVFTCVAEGTSIATPHGLRAIETLGPGDEVIALDAETGRQSVSHVEAIWPAFSDSLIELSPGLRVTARHPVFADGGWVAAGEVSSGAALVRLDGAPAAAAPHALDAGGRVYDLSVSFPHTYFAAGVLVHNKAAESPGAREIRENLEYRPKTP